MRAFNAAQEWITTGKVVEAPDTSLHDGGASVTLRYAGRVVGRGTSFKEGGGEGLRRAVELAIEDAAARLPLPQDEATRVEMLRSIAVTIELAGPMTPIAADAIGDAAYALSPGIDGVAARLGERIEAIFPEQMLMAGMDPFAAIGSAAGAVTGTPADALRDPAKVRRDLGVTFLTFRTSHLAQPRPGDAPMFLLRGGRVPSDATPGVIELRALADEIATNLAARMATGSEMLGVRGTYLPVSDRFDPMVAAPMDQALVALALWTHARTPGISMESRERSGAVAREIMEALAVVEPGEVAPEAALAGAAMAAGVARLIYTGEEMPDRIAAMLTACDSRMDEKRNRGLPGDSEGSLAAWSLAVRATTSGSAEDRRIADEAVRAAFLATPAPLLAGQMPWLGWGDALLAPPSGPVPSAEALRQMRQVVWAHQLKPADVGADGADLIGGIVFTASQSPLPTWHSLRALSFLAWMLGDARLTDAEEVAPELSRVLGGMRFLRSLTADEGACHMYLTPELADGGVRAAAWDQHMPPDAGAMGLMTVCEALTSLRARSPTTRVEPESSAKPAENP